jgi:hypothetical protein
MTNKVGRNDPCPCGSGKKYKNCCMLKEKEGAAAKYTLGGKRKFKAKVLNIQDKSLAVFGRSTTVSPVTPEPDALQKMKFRMTKGDFRKKGEGEGKLPFKIPTPETPSEKPQERARHLPKPGEEFKPSTKDFRQKKIDRTRGGSRGR